MPDKKSIVVAFFLLMQTIQAQHVDSVRRAKNKRITYLTTTLSMYSVGSVVLYNTWYKPYNTGQFKTFNDQKEWLGMDKVGHFVTSWWISSFIRESAQMSDFGKNQAQWMSILYPTLFMTSIEVMDGFSDGWGFSKADLLTNFGGIAFSYLQSEVRVLNDFHFRYSWNPGEFSALRPNILGGNIPERMLKNYNEQTYWLSMPLHLVHNKIPQWLCLSIGYGADGMLGARENVWQSDGKTYDFSSVDRERQFSLSLDLDLSKFKVKGRAWKLFVSTFRWVKFPAPALHFNQNSGVYFTPLQW